MQAPISQLLRKNYILVLMVSILIVAAALRLAALGRMPPGLYHDEAYNGLDALGVLEGELSLYFRANNGREPMFIYLVALSVGLLGRSPLAVRLASLVPGLVTIAVTYALGRTLFSRRVGLLSAVLLSVTLWHVHLSRVGFRAVLLPLFIALTVWQGALGWRTGRRRHWLAAGALYGFSFYTYVAVRFTPVALGFFGLYLVLTRPRWRTRQNWAPLAWFGLAALVALAPLALFTVEHPTLVLSRPGQVSIWSPEINGGDFWGTLARHTTRTLGMFFVKGDRIWRHNVPWRPVFDPLVGIFFLIGLARALLKFRRDVAMAFISIWTATMLLPTLLAEDAPHFLRGVGVLPIVTFFPALGIDWTLQTVCALVRDRRGASRLVPIALFFVVLSVALVSTMVAYFGDYARAETTAYWFEDGAEALAGDINRFMGAGWDGERMLRQRDSGHNQAVYIEAGLWEEWTSLPFLVPEPLAVRLLPSGPEWPGMESVPTSIFVWPYEGWRRVWSMLNAPVEIRVEEGALSQGDRDPEPYTTYRAFYFSPIKSVPPALFRFQSGIELTAVMIQPDEESLQVGLQWHATALVSGDYTVFVHYMRNGQRLGQGDAQPAGGHYPTSRWRAGDLIHDDHVINLPGPIDTARDQIFIGLYRPEDGQRLELIDPAGNPAGTFITVPVSEALE